MSLQNTQSRNVAAIVHEISALAERIRDSYGDVQIIGIDGFMTAGKTTLAKCLSKLLDADIVSTDDHGKPKRNDNGYVERLDLTRIKNSVEKSIRAGRRVILEGVCLRLVIADSAISTDSTVHVYVKKISKNSDIWYDGEEIEDFQRGDLTPPPLSLSILRYHVKVRPHELANFEYRWRE